jgi:hypothetical protein
MDAQARVVDFSTTVHGNALDALLRMREAPLLLLSTRMRERAIAD